MPKDDLVQFWIKVGWGLRDRREYNFLPLFPSMEQWSHAPNGAHNNNKDKIRKLFPSIDRLVTSFGSHIQRQARKFHALSMFPNSNIQHWKTGLLGRRPNIFTVLFNQRMTMLIFSPRQIRKEDQRSWALSEKTANWSMMRAMHSDTYLLFNLTLFIHSTNNKTSPKTCHNTRENSNSVMELHKCWKAEVFRLSRKARSNNKNLSFK